MITFNEFTEEKLVKAMNLKIGDKIVLKKSIPLDDEGYDTTEENEIFVIKKDYWVVGLFNSKHILELKQLIEQEFAILTEEVKIGELDPRCNFTLDNKLITLHHYKKCYYDVYFCNRTMPNTLFELLEEWYEIYKDKEIYDILKKRLDEPVVTK